ncbi:gliding motility-associated C-terminal domain-containing protein [Daejeonella oryzae]|uniref:gliding motility-associated C-terminal domain-containing protein n=1 Tax=Daejeonella oryzae TaxID=1122943 RepID=UPI0004268A44|nr:T9SS C-terminal target domain-containing protein [Daejeonella oryzae]
MKKLLSFLILLSPLLGYGQVSNDECSSSKVIANVDNYCSADKEFSTLNTTNNDIWFQFTARAFDVNISVSGNSDGSGNLGGTLIAPVVELFADCNSGAFPAATISSNNVTTQYKGGLIIGKIYFIRISGSNIGTFKLCINNYNPIVKPGQDCNTASFLCSKESFTQLDVSGAGLNNNEAAGTCLEYPNTASEQNSAWYKWQAATSGTLTFVITPTANDDIDWVLYDLGTSDNCSAANAGNAIRCNAARGVDCTGPGQKRFTKTGLDLTSTDLSENGGCFENQDGFVRYVDMIEGHVYALLVNNFDRGNNGFTLEFGGTGEFTGPEAMIEFTRDKPCTVDQNYTFSSLSKNYKTLKWTFGDGASIDSASSEGPLNISYSTPGIKTVVLQVFGEKGCSVVATETFAVGLKPDPPQINSNQNTFCIADTIILSTPPQTDAIYQWTGPNGFTSNLPELVIPVNNYESAGLYTLQITINECISDVSTFRIPPIGQTPVVAFNIAENDACTINQNYTFTNASIDFQQILWSFGDDAQITAGSGDGPFTVSYTRPGLKTIVLTARGNSGCEVTLSKTLEVSPVPSIPQISSNKLQFCLNDTLVLSSPQLENTIYRWTGPNNFVSSSSTVIIPVSDYSIAGTYNLQITQGKCSSQTASFEIPPVLRKPLAQFSSVPGIPAKLSLPVSVKFNNQSLEADSYLWDFGDGSTSILENPEHNYSQTGEFDVTLTAFNSRQCSTSIVKGKFIIREENTLFIPNTFSPNADQINDEFVVTITNLKNYRLQIFNRFGTRLFQANDIFDNWKGTYNNEPLPVGTYYYIIDALDLSDESIRKSGSITIIR